MTISSTDGFTLEHFTHLVQDELGLPVTEGQLSTDFDELPDWDSLHLLKLVTALEPAAGRSVPVGRVLEARSLKEIYDLAVSG
ncbi:acyl carrier protein [Streptomyces albidus (ex Kaewkla and Franco 2022)]|uniref:acyl carrier protein n=1 Tax=Streptomyces albidus (ex Kaewkla and Franco 2022) TaxID=722709 RepID=UPI0015EFD8C4|nr:acyl carrier protein [Streptomyces albidus (ex Kaewkla and Franco 2022)]